MKITKKQQTNILFNMGLFWSGFFDCVKRRKGYFLFLLLLTVLAVVLGVIAAVNFDGEIVAVDLSNIAYIKFLKGNCGFMSMIFGLLLSLLIFFAVILICHWKSFLLPLGVLFYLYLVYSQTAIFISLIMIYGILNCIILAVLLFVYSILIWCLFELALCELIGIINTHSYFKTCFSLRESKVLIYLIGLTVITIIFSLILMILKNYVILLVF